MSRTWAKLFLKTIPFILIALLLSVPVIGCNSSGTGGGEQTGGAAEAIVFVRGTDIWLIRPDGTGETRLTATSDEKAYPRLSPDGESVVFTSFSGSEDTMNAVVKRVVLAGMTEPDNGLETLVDGFAPCFDPGGKLYFARTTAGATGSIQTRFDNIYSLADDGSDKRLTDFSSVVDMGGGLTIEYLQFSREGDKLAFMRGRRSDSRWIAVMNPDGTNISFLETPPVTPSITGRGLADGAFDFFDNESLLISHGDLQHSNIQSNHKLYRVDLQAQSEAALTRGAEDLNPALSPDLSRMVFERGGQVMLADADGGGSSSLTSGTMPSWGKAVDVQGGGDEEDGDTTQAKIAYVKDYAKVCIANEDGSSERQLTSDPANAYGALAFSPSGEKLSGWLMRGDSMPTLVVIDVASGNQTDLWSGDLRASWIAQDVDPWFGNTSWGSESVLYATGVKRINDKLIPQVVKIDITSRQVQVIESAAQNPAASADGTKLLYVKMPSDLSPFIGHDWGSADFGDLMLRNLSTSLTTLVRNQVFEALFTPQENRLVVLFFSDPDLELFITDLQGQHITTLAMVGPTSAKIAHPAISPSGDRAIFYAQSNATSEIPSEPVLRMVNVAQGAESIHDWGRGKDPAW